MKYWFIVLSVLLLVAIGCQKGGDKPAAQQATEQHQTLNITADMLAVSVDPNCGMDLSKAAIKDTTVCQGKLYGFCSHGCKTAFLKNPDEKLAKLEAK